jgi:arsenate reductase
MKITLYHNPHCSKSREALKILQENGIEVSIIDYLKTPLSLSELESIAQKLNMHPRQFMRTNEAVYKTEELANTTLTNIDLFQAIINHPRLLERPIAVSQNSAAVGRPPENVLALL